MNTNKLRLFIETSLKEDLGDGDHTSMGCIPKNAKSSAKLLIKDNGAPLISSSKDGHGINYHIEKHWHKQ